MKNFVYIYLSIIWFCLNNILSAQATNFKAEANKNKSEIKNFKVQLIYLKGSSLKIDSTSIDIKEQQPEIIIGATDSGYSYQQKDSLISSTPISVVSKKTLKEIEQGIVGENGTLNLDTSKTTNVDNNRDANQGENIDNNRDKNRDLKRDKNRDRGREAKRDKNRDRNSSKDKGRNIYIKIKIKSRK